MSGLTEVTEATMIAAHKAGAEYWRRNKPRNATRDNLASLARSKGWHDGDCDAWLAGFYGAWRREDCPATRIADEHKPMTRMQDLLQRDE